MMMWVQLHFLILTILTIIYQFLTIVSNSSSCDLLLTSGGFPNSAGRRKLQCHLPCFCKPTSSGDSYHCNVVISANPPAQVLFNLCILLISFSYCHNFIVTMSSSNDLLCLRKSPCMAGTGTANVPKLPNSPFPSSPLPGAHCSPNCAIVRHLGPGGQGYLWICGRSTSMHIWSQIAQGSWVRGSTGEEVGIGPVLALRSVSRHHGGAYNCIASNPLGSSDPRTLMLGVQCE